MRWQWGDMLGWAGFLLITAGVIRSIIIPTTSGGFNWVSLQLLQFLIFSAAGIIFAVAGVACGSVRLLLPIGIVLAACALFFLFARHTVSMF